MSSEKRAIDWETFKTVFYNDDFCENCNYTWNCFDCITKHNPVWASLEDVPDKGHTISTIQAPDDPDTYKDPKSDWDVGERVNQAPLYVDDDEQLGAVLCFCESCGELVRIIHASDGSCHLCINSKCPMYEVRQPFISDVKIKGTFKDGDKSAVLYISPTDAKAKQFANKHLEPIDPDKDGDE